MHSQTIKESPAVASFLERARHFCRTLEREELTGAGAVPLLLSELTELYRLGLGLPALDPATDLDPRPASPHEWQALFERLAGLPLRRYRRIADPTGAPDEPPIVADLAEDLADIHQELKSGLVLYDARFRGEAIWHWRYSFRLHWGRHLTAALHALHSHAEARGIPI